MRLEMLICRPIQRLLHLHLHIPVLMVFFLLRMYLLQINCKVSTLEEEGVVVIAMELIVLSASSVGSLAILSTDDTTALMSTSVE